MHNFFKHLQILAYNRPYITTPDVTLGKRAHLRSRIHWLLLWQGCSETKSVAEMQADKRADKQADKQRGSKPVPHGKPTTGSAQRGQHNGVSTIKRM